MAIGSTLSLIGGGGPARSVCNLEISTEFALAVLINYLGLEIDQGKWYCPIGPICSVPISNQNMGVITQQVPFTNGSKTLETGGGDKSPEVKALSNGMSSCPPRAPVKWGNDVL